MNIGRKISHKLLGMLLIPLLGMSYFSVQIILEEATFYRTHEDINKLARLAVRIGSLVHETQKERGMTAGYIGSSGVKFADSLPQQRRLTDQKVSELHDYIGMMDFSHYETRLRTEVSTVTTVLQQMSGIRGQVDRLSIAAAAAIGYYTNTNADLLAVNAEIATLTDSAEMALTAAAYTNLLQSKERAGIERAVLTNTFSQDNFGPGMLSMLSMLVNEQNAYARVFTSLAPHDQVDVYESTVKGGAVDEVERMRAVAFDKAETGGFGIDPGYWFKTITAKIDLMKKVEDSVAADLIEHCEHLMMLGKNKIIIAASIALVSVIITVLFSYWIMRGILSSITSFHSTIEYVERENDLTARININSKDELGLMSGAFNRMFESFRDIIDKVSESTLHVASASEELSAITERNSAGVRSQQIEAEQVATAMNEMTATVQEVARNAALAAQSASEANNEALEGKKMVQTTIDAINELSGEVDNASHVIQKVESESLKIGSVLDVIRGIAEQTNLLALNAAIEAARAGEQGRGFAVVADEVRTLASRTQNSTLEIQNMIEQLQTGARSAVVVIDASRKKADESVQRAERAGRSLESITLSVATINDMNTQIASAAEEQNSVAEEINRNIININHVAQETADSAEQTTMASEGLARLASELQSLVAQFKL